MTKMHLEIEIRFFVRPVTQFHLINYLILLLFPFVATNSIRIVACFYALFFTYMANNVHKHNFTFFLIATFPLLSVCGRAYMNGSEWSGELNSYFHA